MYGKKLVDMTREELLAKCQDLIAALHKKHQQLRELATDLPPNKAANDRHQKHKLAWGRTKKILLVLLDRCYEYVPAPLAEEVKYALDHAEFLYQKRVKADKTRKRMRAKRKEDV